MHDNTLDIVDTSRNQVIEWLNGAAVSADSEKVGYLYKVKEIVLHKEPHLLNEFVTPIVSFQCDRHADVRKFVVSFIEEIGKNHISLLNEVLPNLLMMLNDSSFAVLKKVIKTTSIIYQRLISWLAKSDNLAPDDKLTNIWNTLVSLKTNIINMVDSDIEGVRYQTIKFMESVIIVQTPRDEENVRQGDIASIFDIPMTMKFTKRRKLEDEAMVIFDLLVRIHASKHVNGMILIACMTSLTNVAILRPQFTGKVVATLESVHTHLPTALLESEVSSVRKHLKSQLLRLLKYPINSSYHSNIMTLLTDLGATYAEVNKIFPKQEEESKKRKQSRKNDFSNGENGLHVAKKPRKEETTATEIGVDATEAYVSEHLTSAVTAEIVFKTMEDLPSKMPSLFSSAYTPIAAAGTPAQIRHVSRLLATQLHLAGLGPGALLQSETQKVTLDDQDSDTEEVKPKPTLMAVSAKHSIKAPRALKFSEITKSLAEDKRDRMAVDCVNRILGSERIAIDGGATRYRLKIITSIATTFGLSIREAILEYILLDIRHRLDLALAWLYEEYCILQGFYKLPEILQHNQKPDHNYNTLFCSLALTLIRKYESRDRDALLPRLYLEAPLLTENALDILKGVSSEQVCVLHLLQQLVVKRPAKQQIYMNILLEQTSHQDPQIHQTAVKLISELYCNTDSLRKMIEDYATYFLELLQQTTPPGVLFGPNKGGAVNCGVWTENLGRSCLLLYASILQFNEDLIYNLATVYAVTNSDIKRVILRMIDGPLQTMDISSQSLLKLLELFPKGAETLITRVLHITTDKRSPSTELVDKVKELYQTRVSDVRFLIPVLNGLSKAEIIKSFPKLIKLNPNVVKEVFHRLLNVNADGHSCISPAEFLIALHRIDPAKCELKSIMKATSLCFAEKNIYTQEVLAIVIQNLMDIDPLPTLLMRTVIQSLSLYPRLIGFCMNILQRLILKQVWKYKKVWEGFIKCCQRTKPNSFQVLLQLPAEQLKDVFKTEPDLQRSLLDHIENLTDSQRTHIPKFIMDILYGKRYDEFVIKGEPMSPTPVTIEIKDEPPDELLVN